MSKEASKLSFSGHETFTFRYPWIAKCIQGVTDYPDLFYRDDAMVILGVGKNMVRSMRHWGEILGVIRRIAHNSLEMEITELGKRVFGSRGFDPYLEYVGTLWLLHWNLSCAKSRASAWYLLFSEWNTDYFKKDQLIEWFSNKASMTGKEITQNTLKRDVDVLIRTYVPSNVSKNLPIEETFDSPLVELELIQEDEDGYYQFRRGIKKSLPIEIFLFALLDFWNQSHHGKTSISLDNVLYGHGSPGAIFRLSESAMINYLEHTPGYCNLSYDETAGMKNIFRYSTDIDDTLLQLIESYYNAK